ncbi:MAG TPA: isocitrate lyase/phosphoenolpyruvate mutase family protein [Stellaceae bacterium]|nr:isocitrate lyase/phosphoenolpyruvate mutase family protein [Stellaceae bacterium]
MSCTSSVLTLAPGWPAARAACGERDLLVVADLGLEEALKRAHAYAEAGADMVLVHSKQKAPEEIVAFARRWQGEARLMVVPTAYPDLTEARIRELGKIGILIYGNHALRSAVAAMRQVFAEIRADGGIHNVDRRIASVEEIFELRVAEMKSIEQKYLR